MYTIQAYAILYSASFSTSPASLSSPPPLAVSPINDFHCIWRSFFATKAMLFGKYCICPNFYFLSFEMTDLIATITESTRAELTNSANSAYLQITAGFACLSRSNRSFSGGTDKALRSLIRHNKCPSSIHLWIMKSSGCTQRQAESRINTRDNLCRKLFLCLPATLTHLWNTCAARVLVCRHYLS